jgi:hypothetical protein
MFCSQGASREAPVRVVMAAWQFVSSIEWIDPSGGALTGIVGGLYEGLIHDGGQPLQVSGKLFS